MLEQEEIYLSRCSIRSDVNLKLGLGLFLKHIYCAKYSDTWYVSVVAYICRRLRSLFLILEH
jgi:hypothetical protein